MNEIGLYHVCPRLRLVFHFWIFHLTPPFPLCQYLLGCLYELKWKVISLNPLTEREARKVAFLPRILAEYMFLFGRVCKCINALLHSLGLYTRFLHGLFASFLITVLDLTICNFFKAKDSKETNRFNGLFFLRLGTELVLQPKNGSKS